MFRYVRWMALLSGLTAAPVLGATALQCVPYARIVSGVEIYGDALTWWDQAQDHYKRGSIPKKGAVLAFRPVGPMTLGHVAVVSRILDDRRVLIRHANWSSPGAIEEDVLAIDVSDAGDWSQVRVWHSPTGQMGARINPTFGFIYPAKAKLHPFTPDPALGSSLRYASARQTQAMVRTVRSLRRCPGRRHGWRRFRRMRWWRRFRPSLLRPGARRRPVSRRTRSSSNMRTTARRIARWATSSPT